MEIDIIMNMIYEYVCVSDLVFFMKKINCTYTWHSWLRLNHMIIIMLSNSAAGLLIVSARLFEAENLDWCLFRVSIQKLIKWFGISCHIFELGLQLNLTKRRTSFLVCSLLLWVLLKRGKENGTEWKTEWNGK